jgi:hypothetical protein
MLQYLKFSKGLSLVLSFSAMGLPSLAQPAPIIISQANDSNPEEIENTVTPVNQTETLLSIKGGKKLMEEAQEAIANENYDLAANKLQQARRIFNQLSNFYLQLGQSFSGIDNRIAEGQRADALETASLRDESTYQLALVHRAQNKPELAVPLLIQIIRSQNPTSDLGKKCYQQLYEIGFVSTPFEGNNNNN